jgi:hypothetical protein
MWAFFIESQGLKKICMKRFRYILKSYYMLKLHRGWVGYLKKIPGKLFTGPTRFLENQKVI